MRIVCGAFMLLLANVAAAFDITTCGQVIQAAQIGTLQNDLVCPNESP